MTLPPLLNPSFWFDPNPPPLLPWIDRGLLVLFCLLLIGGIAARAVAMRAGWEKTTKKLLIRAAVQLSITGIFGLFLYGLSFERIPVFAARFGYILWLALAAAFAWNTYDYVSVKLPIIEQRKREQKEFSKWLPKSR